MLGRASRLTMGWTGVLLLVLGARGTQLLVPLGMHARCSSVCHSDLGLVSATKGRSNMASSMLAANCLQVCHCGAMASIIERVYVVRLALRCAGREPMDYTVLLRRGKQQDQHQEPGNRLDDGLPFHDQVHRLILRRALEEDNDTWLQANLPNRHCNCSYFQQLSHTSGGEARKKTYDLLLKTFIASISWSCFQWFYEAGKHCSCGSFPTFGLKAFKNRFYFDFAGIYVGVGMMCPPIGVGMMCPPIVNISLLLGSDISWGIMWPYITPKKGDWYPANTPKNSLLGLSDYQDSCVGGWFLQLGKVAAYHSHKWAYREPQDQEANSRCAWNNPVDSMEATRTTFTSRRTTLVTWEKEWANASVC